MELKYTLNEGFESLERIKLMMGYDMSQTLKENLVEQKPDELIDKQSTAMADIRTKNREEKEEFLSRNVILKTPYNELTKGNTISIPKDSKIVQWSDSDSRINSYFKSWIGTGWQEYIPKEESLKQILPSGTLRSFTTPDGVNFKGHLERMTEKLPYTYRFIGHYDKDNNPYQQEKYVGKIPNSLQKGNWFEENWAILAQLAASLAVGIATAGQSLVAQAMAQLAVDLVFTTKQLVEGDNVGALMTFIIGLAPVIGRLSKFGTKVPLQFLKKYGTELSKMNDPKTVSLFYNSLKGEEKLLMTRLIEQTPAELKKMADEGFTNALKKAVKDGTIDLEKIPQSQRLWWKQNIVELGSGLGAGIGVATVVAKKEQEKGEEKMKSLVKGDEPAKWTDEQAVEALNKSLQSNEYDDE